MKTRHEQALATKQKIIDVSRDAILSKSVDKITIDDITKACGIAKGTFYYYFKSKEELFVQIALFPGTAYTDRLVEKSEKPVMVRLREYFLGKVAMYEKDGVKFTRNILQYKMSDTYRKKRDEIFPLDYEIGVLNIFFKEAIKSGELSVDTPISTLAYSILYSLYGIEYQITLYEREINIIPWAKQYCDYMENVLFKPFLICTNKPF